MGKDTSVMGMLHLGLWNSRRQSLVVSHSLSTIVSYWCSFDSTVKHSSKVGREMNKSLCYSLTLVHTWDRFRLASKVCKVWTMLHSRDYMGLGKLAILALKSTMGLTELQIQAIDANTHLYYTVHSKILSFNHGLQQELRAD